jgi:TPR repeat protein
MSPDTLSYDNPFPTFPGAKKKTSVSEERDILEKMASMELGAPPPGRARPTANKGQQDKYPNGGRGGPTDDYGRPSLDSKRRGSPPDDYGRPSIDSQRNMPPRGYPPQGPPQQGYPEQRRPQPGPNQGYGPPPRQNMYAEPGYNDRGGYGAANGPMPQGDFGPPSRSQTVPMEPPMQVGRQPPMPGPLDGPGLSAPYNGPIGRGMPPRPATASGNRPAPQRQYQNQGPPPVDPYVNPPSQGRDEHRGSVSDFYDSYYDTPDPRQTSGRPTTAGSELPNFDAVPTNPGGHRRGASIDEHMKVPVQQGSGYQQAKPMQSQADARGLAQPQAAVFEMVGDAPPMPNGYPSQNYQNEGYENNRYNQEQNPQQMPPQNFGGYNEPPSQASGFVPPPRSASAAPRSGPHMNGLPSGPRPVFNGLPNGPSPNGPSGMPPRSNTMNGQRIGSAEGLPSHPPPVRAGLIPNSVAAQASDRPIPVRNYNNINTSQQQVTMQNPPAAIAPRAAPASAEPTPVTNAELEQLRSTIKANPNDQVSSMLLARRLVEASEVLVPLIADQKARAKAREKYIMDAFKLLKKLVSMQNPEAMFYLADCYGRGALGLEVDNKEAFTLYQSAAKAGHAAGAYRTAVCCELGNDEGGGTRKDPLKAIQWYKRAATLGDTPAMYKMGMIQLKGLLGQPRNPREAVGWLKRAAERADAENPHALHELGLLYEQPQDAESSVVRDEAYSFQLFNQAADLGYKFSQFRLGAAYEYGLFNCPIDPRQSIMWYSRAAAQEEHQSELALSGWYLTGSEGVLQQSDTEAYLWARKAAMAGLAKAEYAMGYFTEVGIGAPAALEDAKRWYWRAAGMYPFSFQTFIHTDIFPSAKLPEGSRAT